MNELEKEFLQKWSEFETAVFQNAAFQKIQRPLECKDPVLIITNSGLFNLDAGQVSLLEHLRDIHEITVKDAAQSVAITKEEVVALERITVSIKVS